MTTADTQQVPQAPLTKILATDGKSEVLRLQQYVLQVTSGPDRGKKFKIKESPIYIGNLPGMTVCLNDSSVSRKHCEIAAETKGFLLRDLGSTNGTFFQNHQIKEVYLNTQHFSNWTNRAGVSFGG